MRNVTYGNKFKKSFVLSALAILTATALFSTSIFTDAAQAAQSAENTPKEEVAYVNLNSDGSVRDINIVNIFDKPENQTIIDYGEYSHLRNMTTEDEINYNDGKIQINTDAEKLYYQGTRTDTVIPWRFVLHYYLNGQEYSASEIVGKNGKFKMTLSVTENPQYKENSFFDHCALQISTALDSSLCTNITAKGATIANAGGDKQLTWTLLAGTEKDLTLTADVVDFQMKEININGLPLTLDIQVDNQELLSQMEALTGGISALDAGASELNQGAASLQGGAEQELKPGASTLSRGADQLEKGTSQLADGGSDLKTGTARLARGASTLNQGARDLDNGIRQMESGLKKLDRQSDSLTTGSSRIKSALKEIQNALRDVSSSFEKVDALIDASSAIQQGIDDLSQGAAALEDNAGYQTYKKVMTQNGVNPDGLKAKNTEAIEKLTESVTALQDQIKALQEAGGNESLISQIQSQITQLQDTIKLLAGNNEVITGTEIYFNTLNQNIQPLYHGITHLQTQYGEFHQSLNILVTGLENLTGNVSRLTIALNRLISQYSDLDSGIHQYTDSVSELLSGCRQIASGSDALLSGTDSLNRNIAALDQGTSQLLSGITAFYHATGTLSDGSGKLDQGISRLLAGLTRLHDGTDELRNGTNTLKEKTNGMSWQVQEKIDRLLSGITGSPGKVTSFASEKNKNTEAVQFVIKTEPLKSEEPAVPSEKASPEKLPFWQKLLRLFKIGD